MKTIPKPKKCKICRADYTPFNSLQKVCGQIACAIEQGKLDKAKNQPRLERARLNDDRKALRKDKDRIKRRSAWIAEAQTAVNAFIRERDKGLGCISCGTKKPDIQYCAGHYRTKSACPALRFDPLNIHLQCNKNCNLHLSGNIRQYRPALIERIGLAKVEWLEGPHPPKKYTIDDLKAIKADYRAKLKELKEINNNSF